MAKKPMPEDEGMPGAPFWMTTYGDMVTLLLTFFILMFAMSSVNEQKFMQAATSLAQALGVLPKNVSIVGEASPAIGTAGIAREQIDMVESMEQIAEMFQEEALQDVATVEVTGPGEVLIRMGDEVLFDPGESGLKPVALRVLAGIAKSVQGKTESIYVEGHTDNVPISTAEFRSNWELSSARALSVVRLLEEAGVPPEQLAAVGHSQYIPIAPNDTPENRAKNRRVELWIIWSSQNNE
ncbi:MAG: flagellar motor protein MotB [Fidelibacterota bacterium]|nr:MAG: flagellar motor protein MotB [Candidatus Neomarinimicrobiota bacterium]